MGHYRNGNYYRGRNDGELQWIEDAANLVFSLVFYGVCALAVGVWELTRGLFNLITSDDNKT